MTATSAPATIPQVSEEACPVEVTCIPTVEGRTTTAAVVRRPPGTGDSVLKCVGEWAGGVGRRGGALRP